MCNKSNYVFFFFVFLYYFREISVSCYGRHTIKPIYEAVLTYFLDIM